MESPDEFESFKNDGDSDCGDVGGSVGGATPDSVDRHCGDVGGSVGGATPDSVDRHLGFRNCDENVLFVEAEA